MKRKPVIFKFGGTSLQSPERLKSVADQIVSFEGPLVVVTSALAGVTDQLVALADGVEQVEMARQSLYEQHRTMAASVDLDETASNVYLHHLETTLVDLKPSQEITDAQKHDLIFSIGERLSTKLVSLMLDARGVKNLFVDSRGIIRTSGHRGGNRVNLNDTIELSQAYLEPLINDGSIPVVTGYLASNADGATTTLGRNGSDLTATVLGAALRASEVWIWTDVDGILTADPRHHAGAKLLPEISFREAAEMAYFGASVIHPHTLWPVLATDIAVRIKNSLKPENEGTLISANPKLRGTTLITTSVSEVTLVTVSGYGMVGVPGVAASIFGAVKDVETNVLMISQSSAEHNISFVIKDAEVKNTLKSLETALADWLDGDRRIDNIRVVPDVGIITVVGENMRHRAGIAGKIFSALGHRSINVIAIAQGSSEYSISMVLDAKNLREAVDSIHEELDTDDE